MRNWLVDPTEILLELSDAWRAKETFASYTLPLALAWDYLKHDGVRWFPVIVDLALNGPLPCWGEVCQGELAMMKISADGSPSVENVLADYKWTWEDVHPGWRFVRILEFLRDQRPDLSEVPFLGTTFLHWYPPEMDLELFIERTTEALGWPGPEKLFRSALGKLGPEMEDDREFFDNCNRLLFSRHLEMPGVSAFPLHFLHFYEHAGLWPAPFVVIGDSPAGTSDADRLHRFAGLHFRLQMTDILLRPLGNSWFTYSKEKAQCPLLEPPLSWLCDNRQRIPESRCANIGKQGCLLPGFFEHNLGIGMDDIVWFG